jgi:uncharacterized protein
MGEGTAAFRAAREPHNECMRVTQIYRYPVKSCRGEPLEAAEVEPWGLAGDRRWMLVDDAGDVITAREYPRLVLAEPHTEGRSIAATAPAMPALRTSAGQDAPLVQVSVHGGAPLLATEVAAGSRWFSAYLGTRTRLVYLDDPTRRATDPGYSRPADRVSFADGYPLLLASEASLARLNEWISAGPLADEGPLPMTRFRPNVVVAGHAPPFDEDAWRVVRIGSVVFRMVKGSDRCVFTTINPDTAVTGKEPIATLARHRKRDGKVWFAVNLIPEAPVPGDVIKTGDEVDVLER